MLSVILIELNHLDAGDYVDVNGGLKILIATRFWSDVARWEIQSKMLPTWLQICNVLNLESPHKTGLKCNCSKSILLKKWEALLLSAKIDLICLIPYH